MRAGELSRARGVALLIVMVAVAVLALATTVPLRVQQTELQRERERELLFIGRQFREAIASYRAATPGGVPQYPKTLEDLLHDKRYPMPRRHLRRLYRDPFSGETDWVLLREQGAIVGIGSRSHKVPLLKAGFDTLEAGFSDAEKLSDWKFIARADAPVAAAASAPGTPPPAPPEASRPPGQAEAEAQRRAACLSGFSQAVGQCWRATTPAEQNTCRNHARTAMTACMRG